MIVGIKIAQQLTAACIIPIYGHMTMDYTHIWSYVGIKIAQQLTAACKAACPTQMIHVEFAMQEVRALALTLTVTLALTLTLTRAMTRRPQCIAI